MEALNQHTPGLEHIPASEFRARTGQGAGRAKEMVRPPSMGPETSTVGIIIKVAAAGRISGSYMHAHGPVMTVPIDPSLFSVPEDMEARISIYANIDISAFKFPSNASPRNISRWMDGLSLLTVKQVSILLSSSQPLTSKTLLGRPMD